MEALTEFQFLGIRQFGISRSEPLRFWNSQITAKNSKPIKQKTGILQTSELENLGSDYRDAHSRKCDRYRNMTFLELVAVSKEVTVLLFKILEALQISASLSLRS